MSREPDPTDPVDATAAPGATDAAGDGVQLDGMRAAQGGTGRDAFIVLLVSTLAVFIGIFAIYALSAPKLSQGGGTGGESGAGKLARQFDQPASPSR